MAIFTNFIFFILTVVFFKQLNSFSQPYARQMAWFLLTLGISSCFGSAAHGAHEQLGTVFFDTVVFLCNFFSLVAVYFCFRSAYTLYSKAQNKYIIYFIALWVLVLMVSSFINGKFLLIKIHAGIVLIYSLTAHYLVYRKTRQRGSRIIVTGILISFLSILVHSLKMSVHDYFNYKDIAHVIMTVALILIYKGALLNVNELDGEISRIKQ